MKKDCYYRSRMFAFIHCGQSWGLSAVGILFLSQARSDLSEQKWSVFAEPLRLRPHQAETKIGAATASTAAVAKRRPAVLGEPSPAATTEHAERA